MSESSLPSAEAFAWHDRGIIGSRAERIGMLEELYVDERTGRPAWALVRTGRFARRATLVPLAGARTEGEDVRVRHTREEVRAAPEIDPEEGLTPELEGELHAHYGMDYRPGRGVRLHRRVR